MHVAIWEMILCPDVTVRRNEIATVTKKIRAGLRRTNLIRRSQAAVFVTKLGPIPIDKPKRTQAPIRGEQDLARKHNKDNNFCAFEQKSLLIDLLFVQ